MRLSTATKVAIARGLLTAISAARRTAGQDPFDVECVRSGLRWRLDLREGVQLALYLGIYERTTRRRLCAFARPGTTVVDIGANVGAHALPLAVAVGAEGRVLAVEPTDGAFSRLMANLALNPAIGGRVVPVHAALGRPEGAMQPAYYSAWELAPGTGRHPVHQGSLQSAGGARFLTLDQLLEEQAGPPVSVIKLDVDGNELDVLRGASAVLERHRAVFVFEMCRYLLEERGEPPSALLEFFTERGYVLLNEQTLQPLGSDIGRVLNRIPRGGGINVVAQPPSSISGSERFFRGRRPGGE